MPPSEKDTEFLQRVMRWQDGVSSEEEVAALEDEMMASEEKRRLFAGIQMQSMLMNEVLRREAYAGSTQNEVVRAESKPVRLVRFVRWPLAAAAAIAAAIFFWPEKSGPPQPGVANALATVTYEEAADWEDGRLPGASGAMPEGSYSLASGTVRLALAHDDTVTTLAGPAKFDLIAPGHIRLHEGRLSARVSQPDKGFTVLTDALTVLDRGTVFGVDVRPDGEALVSVLEGMVDVSEPGSREMQRIEQGGRVSARPKGRRILQPADDRPSGFEDLWPLTLGVDDLSHLVEFVVPRARHKWMDYRSDSRLYLMPERQRVQPRDSLKVDIAPGVPFDFRKKDAPGIALTHRGRVNSYLLFFRPLEGAVERSPDISGSITFAHPVVGVISDSARLQVTDDTFGHPRVVYRDKPRRGIERWRKPAERDIIRISKDGRRLYFDLHATAETDEFRVLVAAP
jgi:ferric-dicitrate binding protein FerR (iron transport regulator)